MNGGPGKRMSGSVRSANRLIGTGKDGMYLRGNKPTEQPGKNDAFKNH